MIGQNLIPMNRRHFLGKTAALSAGLTGLLASRFFGAERSITKTSDAAQSSGTKLTPPAKGRIPIAFCISQDVTLIDFAGPWEVFNNVMLPDRGNDAEAQMPFDLYTVSDSTHPVHSGALQLIPNFTFENVPAPKVVVIPAQRGSAALHNWLKQVSKSADVTMSVCTGAFQLARAGLLSGKPATTHHEFTDKLQKDFPDIAVKRGLRFVESSEKISTAGGLSSGIDLALHVVERYFGRTAAERTAAYMEYQGRGWVV